MASAARQAGCGDDAALAFAGEVDEAAAGVRGTGGAALDVTIRLSNGLMEVRVGSGADARSLTVHA